MVRNLEDFCNEANAKHIRIEDRERYTGHFNALKDMVYSYWKKSKGLDKLVKGTTLCGGYGDNLKVSKPDEYDLLIHLVFPENDKIIVKADASNPGNVLLDMTKVMEIIAKQEHNKPVFDLLQKIVNNKKQLLEDKLQSFLHGIMTQTLNKMGNRIEVQGEISHLSYKKCGPAHNILVKGPCEYSVDFVPAIKLSAAQLVLAPEQRKHFGGTLYWDAVPKPMKPAKPDNPSFRTSFYEAERSLLHGKQNLKSAIRMIKHIRNEKNKANLKSYHIKTVFLWQVMEKDASYWEKPKKEILIEMLGKLADLLALTPRKGRLPYFWDPKLDMFADLTDDQRTDMFNCFRKCEYVFRKADGNLNDDNENSVHSSFKGSGRNGQKMEKTSTESEQKKPTETKPNAKVESTPVKPNPKPSVQEKQAKPNLADQKKCTKNANGTKSKTTTPKPS
ncbi:uncharacterized protein LOC6548847 [Drosophila erecta]|uniref:Cyclic GMP-AMP synthase-like receptor 1 n=1 Tax=Drosophila erecta TaxID=7220 RepID=CGLR1_DROER|nr:uncharacterized protein LOC6548847 [Drosophila erecta]B3NQ14.1 RecName: Full=Cyclic GMP-AMP synthase-like receptor 1; Short=cGLR1 [Drosophila erecta]EDV55861.1 uncharacterized protein Dere_GG20550 [Drosophila erecta]